MLSIRTNYASLEAQRNLSTTQSALDSSISHLSSGMRITTAGDDAAGLGISAALEAQVASYNVAARNANDGISVAQTAEGALNAVTNILSRMRELVMEQGDAVTGGSSAITTELGQLQDELTRIDGSTEFNGTTLFGGGSSFDFQVGIRSGDTISVDTSGMAVDAASLSVDGAPTLDAIDAAIDTVSGFRATLGAAGNRLQNAVTSIQAASTNISAADSRIRDVDVAEETSKLSRSQVLAQAGISVLAQANQMPQMALKLLG
jgi:flagellin